MSGAEDPESIARRKAALRTELLGRRASLDPVERRRRGEHAVARLLDLPVTSAARRIFTCLSFGSEIDTWRLIERWLGEGREVYVPRADTASGRLHLHRYPCSLVTLSFGLRQPKRSEPELPAEAIDGTIDLALVLGVGFDRIGYRLGYGSGFFDRFLAGRPFPALGLTLESELVERLPVASHDVPMAAIVTEDEILRTSTWRKRE